MNVSTGTKVVVYDDKWEGFEDFRGYFGQEVEILEAIDEITYLAVADDGTLLFVVGPYSSGVLRGVLLSTENLPNVQTEYTAAR